MKKKALFVLCLILLITFLCCACEEDYSLPEGRDEDGTVRIIFEEDELGSVSIDEILKLSSKTKSVTYSSTTEGKVSGEFTGTLLSDIIKLVDKAILEEYDGIIAHGSDGYFATITMDEARQLNNVYIMYLKDGEPLPTYKGTAERSMRMIVTNDQFGIRFTNYLVDIELTKDED